MSEEAANPAAEEGQARRQPVGESAEAGFKHMLESYKSEVRRGDDFRSEIVLPVSCALLVAAILYPDAHPMARAAVFILPLAAFGYYLYLRIGIAATMNNRQAFLTWRLMTVCFLLGGTFTMFAIYTLAWAAHTFLHI